MYAVIETGGKQYRVELGTELEVELLDVEPGKTVSFDRVLLVADGDESAIGQPVVDGAEVSAEVLRLDRGPKLISFKYRPKARSRVKKGHRQELTVLRISDIVFGGKSAAKTAAKAEQDAKTERMRLEEAATAQASKDAELAAKLAAPAKATTAKAESTAKAKASTAKASTAKGESAAKADSTATKTSTRKSTTKSTAKASKAKADDASAAASDKPAAKKPAAKPRATKKDE
ncbi:MAG: 50S ribosomal protein L21 [Candidatus Limnocylindrales bacterium]